MTMHYVLIMLEYLRQTMNPSDEIEREKGLKR